MSRRVRDVMRSDFIRVSPDEAAADVLRLMSMARVRVLPVVLAGRCAGMVRHGDLARAALAAAGRLTGPVGRFVRTVDPLSPNAPLSEAARRMLDEATPCLPASEEGRDEAPLLGLVTEGALLRAAYRSAGASGSGRTGGPGNEAPDGPSPPLA